MNHYKKLTQSSFTQIWFNLQNMTKQERKSFIKWVVNMNTKNCSFIEYAARPFLIELIKQSECFFNKTGTTTPVKEFIKLGL